MIAAILLLYSYNGHTGHTLYVLHCKLVCKYQCYVFWMILYDFEEKQHAWLDNMFTFFDRLPVTWRLSSLPGAYHLLQC